MAVRSAAQGDGLRLVRRGVRGGGGQPQMQRPIRFCRQKDRRRLRQAQCCPVETGARRGRFCGAERSAQAQSVGADLIRNHLDLH